MKQTIRTSLILLAMFFYASVVTAAETAAVDLANGSPQYMRVNIDRVEIDTQGLAIVSGKLANSIDQLALAIQQLSTDSAALSAEEKEILLNAVKSLDQASLALTDLAKQLPLTAQNLSDQLPQLVRDARQPITELSSGLQSARDGIFAITESLPQATENAKELVNSTLDSALIKFSTYTIILIAVLALALVGVMWFVYRQYLDPLAQKLDSLTGAPEHFAAMAQYMKETSENLVTLQPAAGIHAEESASASLPDNSPPVQDTSETSSKSGSE